MKTPREGCFSVTMKQNRELWRTIISTIKWCSKIQHHNVYLKDLAVELTLQSSYMLIYGIYYNCIIHSFYTVQYILPYTRSYKLYWIQIKCLHLMIRCCTVYAILNQKQLLNKSSGSIPALISSARERKTAIWLSCFRNPAKLCTTAHSKHMKYIPLIHTRC